MTSTIVYVPKSEEVQARIAPGSGIVCAETDKPYRMLYFEGNIYNAVNIRTFADKVLIAAGREAENYPTVAKYLVDPAEVEEVGTFDGHSITVTNEDALREWIGDFDPSELETS